MHHQSECLIKKQNLKSVWLSNRLLPTTTHKQADNESTLYCGRTYLIYTKGQMIANDNAQMVQLLMS